MHLARALAAAYVTQSRLLHVARPFEEIAAVLRVHLFPQSFRSTSVVSGSYRPDIHELVF